ncbi:MULTISPECIES: RNA polymerase sigma factor [Chitinophagaceae]
MIYSDSNILDLLHQGDVKALDYLIRIYLPSLQGYAVKIIVDEAEAADIVEDLFIKLWQNRYDFNSANELKGFLFTSIRNACLNKIRSRKRETVRHEAFEAENRIVDTDYLVEEEMLIEIRKSIDELPPKMRKIFILSVYNEMSNDEIADFLNLSSQTVRNQKSNAIAILRKKLKGHSFLFLICMLLH